MAKRRSTALWQVTHDCLRRRLSDGTSCLVEHNFLVNSTDSQQIGVHMDQAYDLMLTSHTRFQDQTELGVGMYC